jgi:RNA polymerase sigma-70 factor (ECF subfamily)
MAINPDYHHNDTQLSEELIWIEAAKLNPEKFAPLYSKYYKPIFSYVFQRLDSKDTAFDITAQVFYKALINIKSYEFKGVPFASWLYRIAYNELMQLFKSNKIQKCVNADVSDLRFICETNEEPFFEEYIPLLQRLLVKLEEQELQLVEMRYFEKRPFKEVAEILNITEVNAKVKMHRIIEKLKKELKKIKV